MKTLLTILLFLIHVTLKAPADDRIILFSPVLRHPYAEIITAIGTVESNGDNSAFNKKEIARGYFQIREIRLKDFNQRTGLKFTKQDLFIYHKAEIIFLFYASDFNPDSTKAISREWNKSKTGKYIDKVQKQLDRRKSRRKYVFKS